jgi:hypothetical protein
MFYAEADDWKYTTDNNEILGASAYAPRITSAYALFPFFSESVLDSFDTFARRCIETGFLH